MTHVAPSQVPLLHAFSQSAGVASGIATLGMPPVKLPLSLLPPPSALLPAVALPPSALLPAAALLPAMGVPPTASLPAVA
jgi:hypothetical protein